jgi:hypothetical protein
MGSRRGAESAEFLAHKVIYYNLCVLRAFAGNKVSVPTMFSFACRFCNEQLTRDNDCKAIWPH